MPDTITTMDAAELHECEAHAKLELDAAKTALRIAKRERDWREDGRAGQRWLINDCIHHALRHREDWHSWRRIGRSIERRAGR